MRQGIATSLLCRALAILGFVFPATAGESHSQAKPTPDRPNILLILADDLGYSDLGCYNKESKVPTPHLDRLAREGMRFTDAHSPSTVCTPTRYSLLTGQMAFRINYRGVFTGVGGPWMEQIARNVSGEGGFLAGKKYLIRDRDPLYTEKFDSILKAAGVDDPQCLLPAVSSSPTVLTLTPRTR
jgi:hypothetical protein